MLNRSSTKIVAAFLSSAALIAVTAAPGYAHSARYCRDYAAQQAAHHDDTGDALVMILPFAAIGAGAGALVGLAASGISVGTGAIVGTGIGAGLGTAHAVASTTHHGADYDQVYAECRASY